MTLSVSGFYVIGNLKGIKVVPFTNQETGEIKERITLGIQLEEPDGYGGFNSVTQDIRIEKDSYNAALRSDIEKLKNKKVTIKITPREWAIEGGKKGIIYYFNENSTIQEYQG